MAEPSTIRRTTLNPTGLSPRSRALALLDGVGQPLSAATLADLSQIQPGSPLVARTIVALLERERRDATPNPRLQPVWLVPALETEELTPAPALLARSDWPVERRLVSGRTRRVATLTVLLCLLDWQATGQLPDVGLVLLERLARSVPDATDWEDRFNPARIRQAVRGELDQIAPLDAAARAAAAARLAQLPPDQQRWGRLPAPVGLAGGVTG